MLSGGDRENQCCCASPTPLLPVQSHFPGVWSHLPSLCAWLSAPRSPHSFRGSWGSLGCCSHLRLFECLAPHQGHLEAAPARASLSLNQCCSLEERQKGIFPRARCATSCSPRCPHACPWDFTQHPSLPSWAQGDGDTAAAPGCLSSLWPWAGRTHPCPGHRLLQPWLPLPCGSLRSLCSICLPAWSCCQTSHCDTVPEAELAPLVSQTVPKPCGCQREPNPGDWPGAADSCTFDVYI